MMTQVARKLFGQCPPLIRKMMEKVNRGRVVRRKLGKRAGGRDLYVSPEASLIWAYPWATGEVDPQIEVFCREFIKPGACVWDLGANVGVFSFTAAYFAGSRGSVLSVEPDPFLAQLIMRTESNPQMGYAPVSVVTAAISSESGSAILEVPERSRASNAIIGKSECTQRGGVRERLEVRVVTADQLATRYSKPSVVKMDIEGSELDALLGGKEIFPKERPVFLMEVQQKNKTGVTEILRGWGYCFYPLGAALKTENAISCAVDDIIAIPQ